MLLNSEIEVALEPYHFGTAKVTGFVRNLDKVTLTLEAIDMTEVSRLFHSTSSRTVTSGREFTITVRAWEAEQAERRKFLRYVYPV